MASYMRATRPHLRQDELSTIIDMPVSPGMNIDAIIEMYTYSDKGSRIHPSILSARHVSSIYSLNEDYAQVPIEEEVLSSLDVPPQGHTRKKSSASGIFRRLTARPQIKDQGIRLKPRKTSVPGEQEAGLHQELAEVHPGALVSWGMPEPQLRESDDLPSSESGGPAPRPLTVVKTRRLEDRHTKAQKLDAARWAEDYQSAFHPVSPSTPELGTSHAMSTNSQVSMSPRITNVCDGIVLPEILRDDSADEATPPSPLSRLSSRNDSLQAATLEPLLATRRPPSQKQGRMEKQTRGIALELDGSVSDSRQQGSLPSRGNHEGKGIHCGNREANQNVLSTTARTELGKDKARSVNRRPRERSPAIPLTDYQKYGAKAWERPRYSKKQTESAKRPSRVLLPSDPNISIKSPARTASPPLALKGSTRSSNPSSSPARKGLASKEMQRMLSYNMDTRADMRSKQNRSKTQKLATAFQSGTEHVVGLDRQKSRTREEQRKVELKKRIKVLVHDKSDAEGRFF